MRKWHEIYVGGFSLFIIILLTTHKFGSDKNLTDYLNFALALSSLILAILAIVITIQANSDQARNFLGLRDAVHDTSHAADRVNKAADNMLERLTVVQSRVEDIGNRIKEPSQTVNQQESQNSHKPITDKKESLQIFLSATSNNGVAIIWLGYELSAVRHLFDPRIIEKEIGISFDYFIGFLMASAAAGVVDISFSGSEPGKFQLSIPYIHDTNLIEAEIAGREKSSSAQQSAGMKEVIGLARKYAQAIRKSTFST